MFFSTKDTGEFFEDTFLLGEFGRTLWNLGLSRIYKQIERICLVSEKKCHSPTRYCRKLISAGSCRYRSSGWLQGRCRSRHNWISGSHSWRRGRLLLLFFLILLVLCRAVFVTVTIGIGIGLIRVGFIRITFLYGSASSGWCGLTR